MNLPDGTLLKSRVVADPRDVLAAALDEAVTGYAVVEPQETLLLDAEGRGVITFVDGVPRLAYYTGTDRGGPAALADLATPGPYRVELYSLPTGTLEDVSDAADLVIPPGMAAERLAGDPDLAASTRRAAPSGTTDGDATADVPAETTERDHRSAVEAFLDDAEKIEAIRARAREEAEARAAEWGFGE